MNKLLSWVLQAGVVLLSLAALVFMLWMPTQEGRNVNSTLYEVYFNDPFLAYAYTASITFFIGAYQVFKLLGYAGNNQFVSAASVKALRVLKYCAVAMMVLIAAPLAYLVVVRPEDDIAGGVAMGLFILVGSLVVATIARMFERRLQRTI